MVREIPFIEIIKKYAKPLKPLSTGSKIQGRLKKPVRAVLFDMYGTLFISESGDISGAREKIQPLILKRLLKSYGVNKDAEEVKKRYFQEIENEHCRLLESGIDYPEVQIDMVWMKALEIDEVSLVRRFSVEFESVFNPVWPMPGLHEIFKFLKEKKIILGVISNAQFFSPILFEAFTGYCPEELGFSSDLMFYSYEHKYAKPSTSLFLKAKIVLEDNAITAENTLYVGNDMLNDIYPADAVGFQTALFAGDRRSLRLRENETRCLNLIPDLVITALADISDYLNKQNTWS
jgi:putative hydrolase of the HAD superfamily